MDNFRKVIYIFSLNYQLSNARLITYFGNFVFGFSVTLAV